MSIPLACFSLAALAAAQGHVLTVDDGPNSYGAVWLTDLNSDGTLDSLAELPLPEAVSDFDGFGSALSALGDLDGDGTPDLAVGAPGDDRAGPNRGAVWILFRAPDGSLSARIPLRPGHNLEGATLPNEANFGTALANLGDLDGDGSLELAVGAALPEPANGSVWILSVRPDASVAREVVVTEAMGGFSGALDNGDRFGGALAPIGDFDGDGVEDLVVGATGDDDGASGAGALWLLEMRSDGRVKATRKLSNAWGAFGGVLDLGDAFGASAAAIGDLNGDGVTDLAVGAIGDDDGGTDAGAVWVLLMNADATVFAEQKISRTEGGLGNHSDTGFGMDVAPIGDRNSDGVPDLAVGASSSGAGAVFVLFLNPDGTVLSRTRLSSEFTGVASGDLLGASLASLGDWDGDGRPDLAVGATLRDGPPTLPDFTTIGDAVTAATPGATVLVLGGNYSTGSGGLEIAKTLTIQAANPGNVRVTGRLKVRNLSTPQSVGLGGLTVLGSNAPALRLENNDGTVWIDDCLAAGIASGSAFVCTNPGLSIENCSDVILNRTRVIGIKDSFGFCNWQGHQAPPGLEVGGGSRVHAYDCVFTGAIGDCACIYGYPYCSTTGQQGGIGIVSTSPADFLFLSGCLVQGGNGGCSASYASGGAGLQTAGPAKVLDSTIARGTGRPPLPPPYTGPIEFLPGASLRMFVNNPTRESEATLFTFEGPPGAAVYVLYSLSSGARYRPALQGTDLLGPVRFLDIVGTLGADGRLESVEHLGALLPGLEILHLFAQSYYVAPSSAAFPHKVSPYPRVIQLGAGAAVQRLDESF